MKPGPIADVVPVNNPPRITLPNKNTEVDQAVLQPPRAPKTAMKKQSVESKWTSSATRSACLQPDSSAYPSCAFDERPASRVLSYGALVQSIDSTTSLCVSRKKSERPDSSVFFRPNTHTSICGILTKQRLTPRKRVKSRQAPANRRSSSLSIQYRIQPGTIRRYASLIRRQIKATARALKIAELPSKLEDVLKDEQIQDRLGRAEEGSCGR